MRRKTKYNLTIKCNPLQKELNIWMLILPISFIVFIALTLFYFDDNSLKDLNLNLTILNICFLSNNININIDDVTLSLSKEIIVAIIGIMVNIIIAIIAVDRKKNNKQFNYLIILSFAVIFVCAFICFFDKGEASEDTFSSSDTFSLIEESSISEQPVTPETIIVLPTHVEKDYITSPTNDEYLKPTLTNENTTSSLNNAQENKNNIKNVLSDLLNFKITTKPFTTKPFTTNFNTTESTTKISSVIPDYYNENGYLINGTFGCDDYNQYCKFNIETDSYNFYDKDELLEYNLLSTKLQFVDESNNVLKNCALWVTVPQAIIDNIGHYYVLRSNYNYENGDTLYFQKGLYSFDLETNDGTLYSSDFIYIDSNSHYIITAKYCGKIS